MSGNNLCHSDSSWNLYEFQISLTPKTSVNMWNRIGNEEWSLDCTRKMANSKCVSKEILRSIQWIQIGIFKTVGKEWNGCWYFVKFVDDFTHIAVIYNIQIQRIWIRNYGNCNIKLKNLEARIKDVNLIQNLLKPLAVSVPQEGEEHDTENTEQPNDNE